MILKNLIIYLISLYLTEIMYLYFNQYFDFEFLVLYLIDFMQLIFAVEIFKD